MNDSLEISKKVWFWIKWPIYIVAGIFIFLGITQLVECFGADASNKFAGIFTPFIVAAVTIYLSNRQHNIADAQRAVAEESKNIAATNRDIAERKLRLELFEKRFSAYAAIIDFFMECYELSYNVLTFMSIEPEQIEEFVEPTNPIKLVDGLFMRGLDCIIGIQKNIPEKKKKLEVDLIKIKFLFNDEINQELFEFLRDVRDLYIEKCKYLESEILKYRKNYDNYKSIIPDKYDHLEEIETALSKRLNGRITDLVEPFLRVPE